MYFKKKSFNKLFLYQGLTLDLRMIFKYFCKANNPKSHQQNDYSISSAVCHTSPNQLISSATRSSQILLPQLTSFPSSRLWWEPHIFDPDPHPLAWSRWKRSAYIVNFWSKLCSGAILCGTILTYRQGTQNINILSNGGSTYDHHQVVCMHKFEQVLRSRSYKYIK